MSSLHRIAVSDILDDFLDCPDAYSAMAHEISKLRQQLATAQSERDAALAERDEAIKGHWIEETCANCHNVFIIRPYHCVTCSSERLNTLELATARADRVKAEAALTEARRVLRDSRERWEQRTALAEAERDAARHMLTVYGCRDAAGHNEDDCPLCSAEHALLNALAERDALREQVTCGEHERMALVVVADAIRDDRTEARRVLRAVRADLDLLVPVAQTSELPVTANAMIRISADIAAVLAQEEK